MQMNEDEIATKTEFYFLFFDAVLSSIVST